MSEPYGWAPVAPREVHGWTLVAVGKVDRVAAWRRRTPDGVVFEPRPGGTVEVGRFERPCASCGCAVRVELSLGAVERSKGPPGEFGRRRCPPCVRAWRKGAPARTAAAKVRRAERDRARYLQRVAAARGSC